MSESDRKVIKEETIELPTSNHNVTYDVATASPEVAANQNLAIANTNDNTIVTPNAKSSHSTVAADNANETKSSVMENIYGTVYARDQNLAVSQGQILPIIGNKGESTFVITKIIHKNPRKIRLTD